MPHRLHLRARLDILLCKCVALNITVFFFFFTSEKERENRYSKEPLTHYLMRT